MSSGLGQGWPFSLLLWIKHSIPFPRLLDPPPPTVYLGLNFNNRYWGPFFPNKGYDEGLVHPPTFVHMTSVLKSRAERQSLCRIEGINTPTP